jgi:hypothetical protein
VDAGFDERHGRVEQDAAPAVVSAEPVRATVDGHARDAILDGLGVQRERAREAVDFGRGKGQIFLAVLAEIAHELKGIRGTGALGHLLHSRAMFGD